MTIIDVLLYWLVCVLGAWILIYVAYPEVENEAYVVFEDIR